MVDKYRCYGKDDLGYPYDALSMKEPDGDWVKAEDYEAALREARDLLVEWREGNAPFTQTDMWLSITAETPADAVDRISDEAMKNTKTYGW